MAGWKTLTRTPMTETAQTDHVTVDLLTKFDYKAAASTTVLAFENDPLTNFIYRREGNADDVPKNSMLLLREGSERAMVALLAASGAESECNMIASLPFEKDSGAMTEQVRHAAGVALWTRPQQGTRYWSSVQAQVSLAVLVVRLWMVDGGKLDFQRLGLVRKRIMQMKKDVMGNDHDYWYLNIVAVHPACKGRGVASVLIREVLKMADKKGKRCYLEATRWEWVAMYERFGFKYVRDLEIRDKSEVLTMFVMVREPVSMPPAVINDYLPEIL